LFLCFCQPIKNSVILSSPTRWSSYGGNELSLTRDVREADADSLILYIKRFSLQSCTSGAKSGAFFTPNGVEGPVVAFVKMKL
jgi:hypothetical protein